MSKAGIPKGTRDFGPVEMGRRNYIFDQIKEVFRLHGFSQIETPAMERTDVLLGKYGEEGDRLIFKVMPRGRKLNQLKTELEKDQTAEVAANKSAEEALRYDLTVPFARFVVQHQNDISFPFKRYQIQPVWRADKPQKGRYREFYQCDVDCIGSDSLLNEIELINIMQEVYERLNLPDVTIKLNNRKILAGIAEAIGEKDNMMEITIALDKLDKMPVEKVNEELKNRGISDKAIEKLQPIMNLSGSNEQKMQTIADVLADSEIGQKGVEEMTFMLGQADALGYRNINFEVTLARGLNYYTGAIFEVTHPDFPSSITGGGRYDDLTGVFGAKEKLSGVGISFGADRIYDLMLQKELFPESVENVTDILFVNFGDNEAAQVLKWMKQLREAGIKAELYPDTAKMKKQMKFANDKNVRYVGMVGEDELNKQEITLKNMKTGEQESLTVQAICDKLGK
ncbi:histidine--tRNA ligase [Salibacter sp.]|uniref:histidine--tRNA ligase n=1 Tax=Salibacter sp. TaxID=2010995 RepID=UPI00287049E6|nr:histidine--tRNA ligase [Salibacter sp.]MDR9397705.1 histidine--tRNA ligase [Salibacter sp.]MDR9487264.1 histidine--tRNA ligase [Salibacter sp.]